MGVGEGEGGRKRAEELLIETKADETGDWE